MWNNPAYTVGFFVVPVVTKLIFYIKYQEQAEGNANGQAQYIKQAIALVALEIPDSN